MELGATFTGLYRKAIITPWIYVVPLDTYQFIGHPPSPDVADPKLILTRYYL